MGLQKLKIILSSFLLAILVFIFTGFAGGSFVSAQQEDEAAQDSPRGTLLPATSLSTNQCRALMGYVSGGAPSVESVFRDRVSLQDVVDVLPPTLIGENITPNTILACGIRTGDIKLWMVPYYIRFMLEFIIGLAGLIAVAGTVYGGYIYMFGGISEEKEKGKKAIMYGVIGMIMTLVAWAVVSIFIALLTSL